MIYNPMHAPWLNNLIVEFKNKKKVQRFKVAKD